MNLLFSLFLFDDTWVKEVNLKRIEGKFIDEVMEDIFFSRSTHRLYRHMLYLIINDNMMTITKSRSNLNNFFLIINTLLCIYICIYFFLFSYVINSCAYNEQKVMLFDLLINYICWTLT